VIVVVAIVVVVIAIVEIDQPRIVAIVSIGRRRPKIGNFLYHLILAPAS
jgi:hypothetical protein